MQTHEAYAEIWAEVLSTNRYLKLALGALCLLCVGLLALCWRTFDRFEHLSPLVVRIDAVGRAEAVRYEAATYVPDVAKPEVKYFLRRFLLLNRERRRDGRARVVEALLAVSGQAARAAPDAGAGD